jgi:hypothetical protein
MCIGENPIVEPAIRIPIGPTNEKKGRARMRPRTAFKSLAGLPAVISRRHRPNRIGYPAILPIATKGAKMTTLDLTLALRNLCLM